MDQRPPWSRWLLGLVLPSRLSDSLCVGSPQLMFVDPVNPTEAEVKILKAYGIQPQVPSDHLVTPASDAATTSTGRSNPPPPARAPATPSPLPSHPAVVTGESATAAAGTNNTKSAPVASGHRLTLSGTVRRPKVLNKLPLGPLGGGGASSPSTVDDYEPPFGCIGTGRAVNPTLTTMEKAASNALYFEQYYDALARNGASNGGAGPSLNLRASRRERRGRVTSSAFEFGRVIGQGAFGVVHIATERKSGRICAIKQLRKTDLLRMGQEGHVRAEKDLLSAACVSDGPTWIPRLYYSFQDQDYLYLALEYMGGGDLLTLLMSQGSLPEGAVRFYAAEMVLALHQTHQLGYIHRDVKPDNFLFSGEGHIRVADFGLATDLHWGHDSAYYEHQRRAVLKRHGVALSRPAFGNRRRRIENVPGGGVGGGLGGSSGDSMSRKFSLSWRNSSKSRRKMAYTICGTNSYMAPEVIRGQGYGFSADWWGLGIIVYEALYGTVPFVGSSRQAARQKILDWKNSLVFAKTSRISPLAVDFMKRLLCEPEERLGYVPSRWRAAPDEGPLGPDGVEQLMAHPWFDGVDWDNIHHVPPPYQPNLVAADDTRHFDEDIPDEPLAPANSTLDLRDPLLGDAMHGADVLKIRKDLAFRGWSFCSPAASEPVSPASTTTPIPVPMMDRSCPGLTVTTSAGSLSSEGLTLSATASASSSDNRHKYTSSEEPVSDTEVTGQYADWEAPLRVRVNVNTLSRVPGAVDLDDVDDGYVDDDSFELVTEPLGTVRPSCVPDGKEVINQYEHAEAGTLRARARSLPPVNMAVQWR